MQSAEIESHQSMRSVDSVGRSRMRFLRLFASFLLSIGAGHLSCAAAELPKTLELAENWKLTSANKLQQGGAAVSLPDFKDADWNAIRRMPATVLEILEEDGVYPNLYVGKNLAENVPQDLYTQDWWHRTTFEAA